MPVRPLLSIGPPSSYAVIREYWQNSSVSYIILTTMVICEYWQKCISFLYNIDHNGHTWVLTKLHIFLWWKNTYTWRAYNERFKFLIQTEICLEHNSNWDICGKGSERAILLFFFWEFFSNNFVQVKTSVKWPKHSAIRRTRVEQKTDLAVVGSHIDVWGRYMPDKFIQS
jgi:hypothetical protein